MEEMILSVLKLVGFYAVAYFLGRHLIDKLEQSIGSAVDRLPLQRMLKFGNAEFAPPTQTNLAESEPPAIEVDRIEALPALDPTSLAGKYNATNQAWLDTVPGAEREHQLYLGLLNWQLGWFYETTNFWILGSQLYVLGEANVRVVPMSEVQETYQRTAAAFADYFRNYSFDQWLSWMTQTSNLVKVEGLSVHITEDGREFLKYIIGRGYPLTRWG